MLKALTFSTLGALLLVIAMLSVSIRQSPIATNGSGLTLTNSVMVFGERDRRSADGVHASNPTAPEGVIGSPVSSFTYQGVLNDTTGNPAVGPVDLRFVFVGISLSVEGKELPTVLSDTVVPNIIPDDSGRFQAQVPMPPAYQVAYFVEHRLQIFDDASNTQIGQDISMSPAPIAFAAEYADRAGIADRVSSEYSVPITINTALFEPAQFADPPVATRYGRLVCLSGDIDVTNDITDHFGVQLATLGAGTLPENNQIFVPAITSALVGGDSPVLLKLRINGGTITIASFNDLQAGTTIHLDGITFVGQ